ncbi:hypothetical protein FHS26_006775 [Rhizobium pisi]|uniref:Uncharacterized protein n=1 Tax=Rhizobium pisi TaxID=574561 RepID=A0A7W5G3K3_9HYPH|nr:hypothetical protein [Rhizobium pisi]MBB3138995.1 hypothetical protein [Rhizobium pisi]
MPQRRLRLTGMDGLCEALDLFTYLSIDAADRDPQFEKGDLPRLLVKAVWITDLPL